MNIKKLLVSMMILASSLSFMPWGLFDAKPARAAYYDGDTSYHNTQILYHAAEREWTGKSDGTVSPMLQLTKLSSSSYQLSYSTRGSLQEKVTLYDLTSGDYRIHYNFLETYRRNGSGVTIRTKFYHAYFTFSLDENGNIYNVAEVLPSPTKTYEDDEDYPFYEEFGLSSNSSSLTVTGRMKTRASDSGDPLKVHISGTYYGYSGNVRVYKANKPPTLTLVQPTNGQIYSDLQHFVVEGYVQDENNDNLTITSTVNHEKRTTSASDTATLTPFTIDYGEIGTLLGAGDQTVTIEVSDGLASISKNVTLTIIPVIGDNKVVLVNTTLSSDLPSYTDPEGDPKFTEQYKYIHDEHYYENSEGKIANSGLWQTSPILTFTKPGHYEIYYRAQDNPKDDERFANFRKWSASTAAINLYVHRKPVAKFNKLITFDGSSNTFSIDLIPDASYDPDRVSSPNKGIVDYLWSYSDDNGSTWHDGKITTLQKYRTYRFRLIVKDVDGAWSEVYEDSFYADPGVKPPVAGFTTSPDTVYKDTEFAITSTASHPDNLPLTYQYYIQESSDSETSETEAATTADWSYTATKRTTYQIRQVVTDTNGLTDEYIGFVPVKNRPPQATITYPSGTSSSNPTMIKVDNPTIQWRMEDDDGDIQSRYQLIIRRTADGSTVYHTGSITSSDDQLPVSGLPEDTLLEVQVRAHDGYEWSDWSNKKYFIWQPNEPPIAAFTWKPSTIWEGDTVKLINESTDPDDDLLTYDWQIHLPDDASLSRETLDVNHQMDIPGVVSVTLTVSDGKLSDSVTHSFEVRALTILPELYHAPNWLTYHVEQGHEVNDHPKDFLAGEVLMVDIGASSVSVSKAEAWTESESMQGTRLYVHEELLADETHSHQYTGYLHHPQWMDLEDGLPKGEYTVHYRLTYANGTVKEAELPYRIIGNAYGAIGVHRVR